MKISDSSRFVWIGVISLRSHRHNMAVNFWTVNDEADMRRLIEPGADGIITDSPDLLLDVLADMGW